MKKKELLSMIRELQERVRWIAEDQEDLRIKLNKPPSPLKEKVSSILEEQKGKVDLKLCYVDKQEAWFTSCSLEKQWGDDWNDAPYEHNAGYPYEYHWEGEGEDRKRVEHQLLKIYWDSYDYQPPCATHLNSPWSVEDINKGKYPWLKTPNYSKELPPIHAGTSLDEFIRLIEASDGGEIFLPRGFLG